MCMAGTKQTARKTSGGKPVAMGRAKNPKADPKPWGRGDRKVIVEFSADDSFDEERPQPVEGSGMPKRVKKRIHLTLPTNPSHVTTTETFTTFFINHSLTKDLRKAFKKRGWTSDNMQELMTNFQKKHGTKIPLPKIYADEDSSDSKGLELRDGLVVAQVEAASVVMTTILMMIPMTRISAGRPETCLNHQGTRWQEKN